jgi:hypothetical protein
VCTGFTISQAGLARHWHRQHTPRWMLRAALNGTRVHPEAARGAAFRAQWDDWDPGVRLDILENPHRSLDADRVAQVCQVCAHPCWLCVTSLSGTPPPVRRGTQDERELSQGNLDRAAVSALPSTSLHRPPQISGDAGFLPFFLRRTHSAAPQNR